MVPNSDFVSGRSADLAKLKLRLRTLSNKKEALQSRTTAASKLSSSYLTLDEGYRLFSNDLDKLQQFVEVNQTAFSKILKKVSMCLASGMLPQC